MSLLERKDFVLSVYPTSRGFAFVLFESAEAPFDWGVKQIRKRKKNQKSLDLVEKLLDRYHPEALVIEEPTKQSKRSERIMRLYKMILHLAGVKQVLVFRYTRQDVRECFASVGAKTKYEIAQAIATQIPCFMHRLPPVRKIWMSEDSRQSLFDAAALGVVHYAKRESSAEEANAATGEG